MSKTSQLHSGLLLAVLLGGVFMGNVDIAIVNIAMPSIRTSLHATGSELVLIASGYTLVYALMLIPGARLGEMAGYRRIFLLGIGVFTISSLILSLAPNALVLILTRTVQGAGAALMAAQVLTGIQLNFEGHERARAIGWYTAVLSGSAVIGQVLGGVLIAVNLFGAEWRSVFLINVPIGLLVILAGTKYLPPDKRRRAQSLDVRGVVALSIALTLLLLPLMLGPDDHWPTWGWLCIAASIPTFVMFVNRQLRLIHHGGFPLLNLQILTQPSISWGVASQGLTRSTYAAILFVLALYLQQGLGKSSLYSGLALVSWVAAFGVVGPLLGRIRKHDIAWAGPAGTMLLAGSFAGIGISLLYGIDSGLLQIILLGFGGLGLGAAFSGMLNHLSHSVDKDNAADMSGLLNTVSQVSAVVGVAAFGTVYLGFVSTATRQAAVYGFTIINFILSVTALLAALMAFFSVRLKIGDQKL